MSDKSFLVHGLYKKVSLQGREGSSTRAKREARWSGRALSSRFARAELPSLPFLYIKKSLQAKHYSYTVRDIRRIVVVLAQEVCALFSQGCFSSLYSVAVVGAEVY